MAWRPSQYSLEGELDDTVRGRVTGWMRFAGLAEKVTFDLRGDLHRDIRGARVRLQGDGAESDPAAARYMEGFVAHQSGKVGDMTAGLPPRDYSASPYFEWYGDDNGRVVIELSAKTVNVVDTFCPWAEWGHDRNDCLNQGGEPVIE